MTPRANRILKLAQFNFKKRYNNDLLGIFWALLNPILKMAVFYIILTEIFAVREENYVLILFSGLIVWQLFVETSNKGMNTLISKRYIIESIQIQRIDFYYAELLSTFCGFGMNLVTLIALSLYLGITYSANLLYFPLIIINIIVTCLGVMLILSVINIYLKDIKHIWRFALLIGFWTSGIFQRTEIFLEAFPPLNFIHPFIHVIGNFRNIFLYDKPLDLQNYLISMGIGLVLLVFGLLLHKKFSHLVVERR